MELISWAEMFHHQQEPEPIYVTFYFEYKGKCPAVKAWLSVNIFIKSEQFTDEMFC